MSLFEQKQILTEQQQTESGQEPSTNRSLKRPEAKQESTQLAVA